MEISHSDIDGKICKTKKGSTSHANSHGIYAGVTTTKSSSQTHGDTSLCGGHGVSSSSGASGVGVNTTPQVLKDFVEKTLVGNESKNWPTSADGSGLPRPVTNDNAKAVAKDLVALNSDEKTIVAGLLAKTIEGGEVVVEIRTVSSTYSMVNLGHRYCGFIVTESLTMQSSEVTFEYSVKYRYVHYI
ncbi:putative p44-77 outer membrane protein, silent [Anaplasma phagocytophilum str. ApNP]|uniref:Putative p44-77 outer membrane protein, silent n=1 Tax=Anaplasma phagocytophilum str. ApNP TaxID=1359153 RepID=A0A0F3NJF5_ANAPH|nr:putative p44-77 outer membrane protein, silent [Anaplasma phagocytophilum str. ApNP]